MPKGTYDASDFNPLPSCEGRRLQKRKRKRECHFNPLPSCEGRRNQLEQVQMLMLISIHSPHARGDTPRFLSGQINFPFQSTPLMRGETCIVTVCMRIAAAFQSTPLMRGETRAQRPAARKRTFQSTPLMRGETVIASYTAIQTAYFNPLPSCEGRLTQRFMM